MSEIIKINDWTLTKTQDNAEPLMLDTEIAGKLGYKNPITIRKLIKRMIEAGQLGVVSTVGNGETGGRAGTYYYLNEAQTLKVIARSKTDIADKILNEVIEVYLAYRKGLLQPAPQVAAPIAADPVLTQILTQQTQLMQMIVSMVGAQQRPAPQPQEERFAILPRAEYPAYRPVPAQGSIPLVPSKAPSADPDADPKWHWLAKVAATLKISFEQAQRIVEIHGIPSRWATTERGKRATQVNDQGFRDVERHAKAMGLLVPRN